MQAEQLDDIGIGGGRRGSGPHDDRLVCQERRRDPLVLGKRMVFTHDSRERVVNERLHGQRPFIDRPTQEADIEAVVDQLGNLLGGPQFGELEFDVGVVPAMGTHDVGQDTVHGGLQRTDMKMTEVTGGRPARGRKGPFAVRERQPGLSQKCVPASVSSIGRGTDR